MFIPEAVAVAHKRRLAVAIAQVAAAPASASSSHHGSSNTPKPPVPKPPEVPPPARLLELRKQQQLRCNNNNNNESGWRLRNPANIETSTAHVRCCEKESMEPQVQQDSEQLHIATPSGVLRLASQMSERTNALLHWLESQGLLPLDPQTWASVYKEFDTLSKKTRATPVEQRVMTASEYAQV
eukprot:2419428-Amphidinium_carterae.1